MTTQAERRSASRHPFFALAEITERSTRYFASARTNELSRDGCYIDMLSPLPPDAVVDLRIVHDGEAVDVPAHVVHSQPNMGMGLRFADGAADGLALLDRWLTEPES